MTKPLPERVAEARCASFRMSDTGNVAFSAPIYYAKVAKRFRARLNPSNARNANPMPISTHVEGSGAPKTTSDGSESVNRTSRCSWSDQLMTTG